MKPSSTGSSARPCGLSSMNSRKTKFAAFLAQYRRELEMAYTPQSDGRVLLLYPRLFFVAQK